MRRPLNPFYRPQIWYSDLPYFVAVLEWALDSNSLGNEEGLVALKYYEMFRESLEARSAKLAVLGLTPEVREQIRTPNIDALLQAVQPRTPTDQD